MQDFNYTLVTDGSSDRALIPILTWLLEAELEQDYIIQSEWADFSSLPRPPKTLVEKIKRFYQTCDAKSTNKPRKKLAIK
jgi:hypothetical protein